MTLDDAFHLFALDEKCRRQNFLSATCQSKHAERAHASRMGWLTSVTPAVIGRPSEHVGLQIRRDVGDVFLWRRRQTSTSLIDKCEQTVIPPAPSHAFKARSQTQRSRRRYARTHRSLTRRSTSDHTRRRRLDNAPARASAICIQYLAGRPVSPRCTCESTS